MSPGVSALPFVKMQGVGNDFVVVDDRAGHELDWSGLAREMCDRRLGVGADGLLVVGTSRLADIGMRMYNPDGTPDVCGNGLRCVARYVADGAHAGAAAGHPSLASMTIATLTGTRRAQVEYIEGACAVTVDMGAPRLRPTEVPMAVAGERVVDYSLDLGSERVCVTALSTGSTHAVSLVDRLPGDADFRRLSPLIEHHPAFPARTSVMWTKVESRDMLRLRIWERGVGETLGCGTGACAAAVAARLHGVVGDTVTVASKGGSITVRWAHGQNILQTGPAEYVFTGIYEI